MSEYDAVKRGRLVLKGEKTKTKRKKKQKRHKNEDDANKVDKDIENHASLPQKSSRNPIHPRNVPSTFFTRRYRNRKYTTNNKEKEEAQKFGGWAKADIVSDITGSVCIEFGLGSYVKALDNGTFTIGPPHGEGEGPEPEEILTAIVLNETKIGLKSGYDKYIGYDKEGLVVGKSDAIGPQEHWEPVFQDGKTALLSSNGCFLSVRESDDTLTVTSPKVSDSEMLTIRYMSSVKDRDPLENVPVEERGNISQIEENYVRKFQKFQDKKIRINTEDRSVLKKAKYEGTLHEALLDRRSKMKADRYCK